jgi:GH25 family lysozyme M1 (1,4-beta-N-acetylmuramidase)
LKAKRGGTNMAITIHAKDRVKEAMEHRQELIDNTKTGPSSNYILPQENNKAAYVERMEAQIDEVESIIDQMPVIYNKLGNKASMDFERDFEWLRGLHNKTRARLDEMRDAGGDAWQDFRHGAHKAVSELVEAVNKAINKF